MRRYDTIQKVSKNHVKLPRPPPGYKKNNSSTINPPSPGYKKKWNNISKGKEAGGRERALYLK